MIRKKVIIGIYVCLALMTIKGWYTIIFVWVFKYQNIILWDKFNAWTGVLLLVFFWLLADNKN